MDMAKPMLLSTPDMNKNLWSEAGHTACFVRDRTVTWICREDHTSYEVIHGRKPSLCHLQELGCKTSVYKSEQERNEKLDSKSETGIPGGHCKGDSYSVLLDGIVVVETKDAPFDKESMAAREIWETTSIWSWRSLTSSLMNYFRMKTSHIDQPVS